MNTLLLEAISTVPAGPWAVGVSGGGDSVALLGLLRTRTELKLHVVHLDHQTRGQASTGDARFVEELATHWKLPCTLMRRDQVEPELVDGPTNLSARFRALGLLLFRRVVRDRNLAGVILAHHADDQAETILHRLIRRSGYAGLTGISGRSMVGGLMILRPLLQVRRESLRDYLRQERIGWREDASNSSNKYLRNRLRKELARHPELVDEMLALGRACGELRDWVHATAPVLTEEFRAAGLARLPLILAEESARRWLIKRGVPADQIEPAAIQRLVTMATDAATPPREEFPGGVRVRRKAGMIGRHG